ncbi:MAG: hypothetical protein RIR51_1020 [Bacteroidota bacterium]
MARIIQFAILLFFISMNINGQYSPGAAQFEEYIPQLKNKNVGIIVNHTSLVDNQHILDLLIEKGVKVKVIFAPEHGFRGEADAGAKINNEKDEKTGLPIVSLYGSHKKPFPKDLEGIDVLIFDIQDIGVRFYTYSSTLHYCLEAAAENHIEFMVLDRGNPNGHYVDGPVLDRKFSSFVGLNPIPLVYGCTSGELANMINGENWLKDGIQANLKIIKAKNYHYEDRIPVDVPPSPNLKNIHSIELYPSICLFEPTVVSVGRGTDYPFEVIGSSSFKIGDYSFIPESKPGASKPVFMGEKCYGYDLRKVNSRELHFSLKYLMEFYEKSGLEEKFFLNPAFFDKLAGTDQLRKQLIEGKSEKEIRDSWKEDLEKYLLIRKKYLLYP